MWSSMFKTCSKVVDVKVVVSMIQLHLHLVLVSSQLTGPPLEGNKDGMSLALDSDCGRALFDGLHGILNLKSNQVQIGIQEA